VLGEKASAFGGLILTGASLQLALVSAEELVMSDLLLVASVLLLHELGPGRLF